MRIKIVRYLAVLALAISPFVFSHPALAYVSPVSINSIDVTTTSTGITVVVGMNVLFIPPQVTYSVGGSAPTELYLVGCDEGTNVCTYSASVSLLDCVVGEVNVQNEQPGAMTRITASQIIEPPNTQSASVPFSTACSSTLLGSIRGTAFEDLNGNGKWDSNEPTLGGVWYKITDGGSWFVCGYVGNDSTYGVPVQPGAYYVMPVAPKGYRPTTPRLTAIVTRQADGQIISLNNNIGFIKDASSPGQSCDQYHP